MIVLATGYSIPKDIFPVKRIMTHPSSSDNSITLIFSSGCLADLILCLLAYQDASFRALALFSYSKNKYCQS